jgi:hypothetical protein
MPPSEGFQVSSCDSISVKQNWFRKTKAGSVEQKLISVSLRLGPCSRGLKLIPGQRGSAFLMSPAGAGAFSGPAHHLNPKARLWKVRL